VLWPTVAPGRSLLRLGIDFPAELRGDHDSLAERCEAFTHEFFVYVGTIDLGRVEERDTRSTAARITEIISCLFLGRP
jgi:hypothetical protein